MGGSPTSLSEVLRTMTGVGGPKHLGGSATVAWLARGDYREGGRSGRADDDFRLFLVVEIDALSIGVVMKPLLHSTPSLSR